MMIFQGVWGEVHLAKSAGNVDVIFHSRIVHQSPSDVLTFPFVFDIRMSVNHEYISKLQRNKMQRFLIYLFLQTLYMFQAVPPPIVRSTKLYI